MSASNLELVVRSIEIIGEASKKIDEEFKATHPHIEWKKMAGARDKLNHDFLVLITISSGILS